MKTKNIITLLAITISMLATACTGTSDENKQNEEPSSVVPPANGDETRYNLSEADTLVIPTDTNQVDTTERSIPQDN